jgi:uncharacterized membrane protein required for colicin V production
MTWLDWVVIALGIAFVVQGLFKGVTTALLSALAIAIAYVAAAILLPTVGDRLAHATPMPEGWGRMIAFLVLFFVIYAVLALMISIVPGGKRPASAAQILGLFAGALKALVASMAAVGILLASPLADGIAKDVERSSITKYIADAQRGAVQDLVAVSPIKFPPVGPDSKF